MPFGIGLMATLLLAWVIFRVIVRRDYLRGGSLSLLSTGLEFLIFGLHANLPYLYLETPWPLFPPLPNNRFQIILGFLVATAGLLTTLAIMAQLSYRITVGSKPPQLRRTGLYRWSRNPQLLSYGLMLGGCVILYPSWQAIAWLVLYGAIALLMVQTEEEHLHNLFGAEFEDYCRQTPRFFPLPGKGGILFERPKD